jgi:hypothetical protein
MNVLRCITMYWVLWLVDWAHLLIVRSAITSMLAAEQQCLQSHRKHQASSREPNKKSKDLSRRMAENRTESSHIREIEFEIHDRRPNPSFAVFPIYPQISHTVHQPSHCSALDKSAGKPLTAVVQDLSLWHMPEPQGTRRALIDRTSIIKMFFLNVTCRYMSLHVYRQCDVDFVKYSQITGNHMKSQVYSTSLDQFHCLSVDSTSRELPGQATSNAWQQSATPHSTMSLCQH